MQSNAEKSQSKLLPWEPIETCPENLMVLFAAYYEPSPEAYRNGSRPYWDYGTGSKVGKIYTGILGANPSAYILLEPPLTTGRS